MKKVLILLVIVFSIISCNKEDHLILDGSNLSDLEAKVAPNYAELADDYFIFFGFYDGLENPVYVFDQAIMVDAVLNVQGNCVCPSEECQILDYLIEHQDITIEIKRQINENFVMAEYNLPSDFPIGGVTSNILEDLARYKCYPWTVEDTNDFLNIDNPIDYEEGYTINNGGVQIYDITGTTEPCGGEIIGENQDRGNTEDLEYGFDGDGEGILFGNSNWDDDDLFTNMHILFDACTFFSSDLRVAADVFLGIFSTNLSSSESYTHPAISEKVADSREMKGFVERFGAELNTALSINNGNIDGIFIDMEEDRPVFSGKHHLFHGLKILINDTEHTVIFLEPDTYSYDSDTGEWEGTFCFVVCDHFGLDRADAMKFQCMHSGFAAWWVLQHQRNYVPFITKVFVRATIKGQF